MYKNPKSKYPPLIPGINMPVAPDLPHDFQAASIRGIESVSPRNMAEISRRTNTVMHKPREMIAGMKSSGTDPGGSYTGIPVNSLDTPVQDADDL
jgi:hypothetical protein